jgi:hypothetical protein
MRKKRGRQQVRRVLKKNEISCINLNKTNIKSPSSCINTIPIELKNKKSFHFPQILITFEFFVDVASINFLSKVNATSRQYKTMPDYLCHREA